MRSFVELFWWSGYLYCILDMI